LLYIVKERCD